LRYIPFSAAGGRRRAAAEHAYRHRLVAVRHRHIELLDGRVIGDAAHANVCSRTNSELNSVHNAADSPS
jgi:hypothetical protein